MKIWFGCTTVQWKSYRKYYFLIRNYLRMSGFQNPFDWLEDADKLHAADYKSRNIHTIYEKVLSAIRLSDGIVIEQTIPNFSSSHQINYALSQRKPVLVMRLHKDNPRFEDSYIDAIKSPYLVVRKYSEENYRDIIDMFVEVVKSRNVQKRYNIVLDRKHKEFLDWASVEYGQSRSKIIRDLIEKELINDERYRNVRRG